MTRPASQLLALALAGLSLGACTARDPARTASLGTSYASLDATLDGRGPAAGAPAPARAATPVAVLPEWIGRPSRLRERDEADAFEQVVTLALAPRGATRDNLVLLRRPRTASAASGEAMDKATMDRATTDGEATAGGRPTEAGIQAELAALFPDAQMQVVTHPAANAYGAYGLAIGRTPSGVRCLYAWQWIADAPALDPADATAGPLSLRVRICRDDITLEAMAAAINQIKLVPRFAGTPVAAARAQTGSPAQRRQRVAHAATVGPRREARVEAPDDARPRPAAIQGRTARIERAQGSPSLAAPPPAGRRYLGVAETPAIPPGITPDANYGAARSRAASADAFPAAQTGTLSADLPPEALRGPSARPPGRP